MPKATSQDLLFVSKAPKERLDAFAAGVSLVQRTGYDVTQLRVKATLDRLTFARSFLLNAEFAYQSTPPMNRVAVSRGYYSLYHSLRSVSFFIHGGDDYEKHSVLPTKLPKDFPDSRIWMNALKVARLERNRADYDPYPKNDRQFEAAANNLITGARKFLPIARRYLRQKGCIP